MAKAAPDAMIDASLNYVAQSTRLFVCNAQPTTYTEASSTFALADVTLTSGDFTVANGDTSGRKVTIAAKSGILIDTSGTANHIALASAGDTTLRYVTTCTSQALTANGSNTCSTNAFDIEIADPT